ncbi:glyoxylase-like metal-dependent hydrolase (beta-lactamase superfamily II) [Actimicrobium sp. GrIS 1.19]|uniref:MBL fold metallo-hydrolase n=1 Tax=Actimicrobium sp. GrIS 1.19 TaxID=3071708 RepID=UPI002E07E5F4|nr:glyoxylase-like metal-dependent hydrolase (beta-lactamase superfamily II) [Actimicrobium sp. GrIS 1.19]
MHRTTRHLAKRTLLSLALASATLGTLLAPISSIAASPAQLKTQVPGFYRMALGDFEITALYDGYFEAEQGLFKNTTPQEMQKLLARAFVNKKGFQSAVNAYLINTGTSLVLVDTGSAKCFGPTLGALPESLKAAGYDASQIDTVVITHLHPDHACGLISADGKLAFPNATLRTAKAESDFWMSEAVAAKAPKDAQGFFKMARESVQPYIDAGKFKPFTGNETIAPGIAAVPTPGHTPGHTSYKISSRDQNLLILGDLIHSYAMQFPRPGIAIAFDVDSAKAIPMRKKIFSEAAQQQTLVAGAHLPFPGIGQIRAEGSGYAWVPVQYAPYGVGR